ncbi:MAG: HEAT repeat domain-containing protein [Candidatus Omnitrophica bacterium]|nr:HEAT repeat domain-containing protein [Candidatus Omnitrophota bacterium]
MMKSTIELKHVGPRQHVQHLLEELIGRLEDRLRHFRGEALSIHVVFEENGARKLYRTSVTCHIPRRIIAAHEEHRDPGISIRESFAEIERQLEKQLARFRPHALRRRAARSLVAGCLILGIPASPARSAEPSDLSPQAVEALRLIESRDPYQQQLGFLRLEALREPPSTGYIRKYVDDRNPQRRADALRAMAAIAGPAAIPLLLRKLQEERHPRVRRAALLGLEPLQPADPGVFPAFLKALRDRHPTVRMAAVDVVSRIDDPRAREAIFTRQQRERHGDVRRVLALALKRLQPK